MPCNALPAALPAAPQVHKAAVGRVHPDRGLGLRFPRFLRIRQAIQPVQGGHGGSAARHQQSAAATACMWGPLLRVHLRCRLCFLARCLLPAALWCREDKGTEDATSADQVAQMYQAQTRKVETAGQRLAAAKQRPLQGGARRAGAGAAAATAEEDSDAESPALSDAEDGAGAPAGLDL